MNFMHDDEFLLLMVHCEDRAIGYDNTLPILGVSDRARLREVGIQTAHEQPAWSRVEPSKGNYNFSYMDQIVKRNRDAGLKSLIQLCGWMVPNWVPKEWRARQRNGIYERETLSLWNDEAQDYLDIYYRTVINSYANQEDVGFFFGEFQGGEGIYPSSWPLYDDAALDDYRRVYGSSTFPIPDDPYTLHWFGNKATDHFLRRAALLYPKHHEIWNAQQRLMDTWSKSFGNFVQPKILERCRENYPDACIVLLQYTYFDSSHDNANSYFVHELTNLAHCETIVEAMFCDGLPMTTPKSIAEGFRGQIVHPAKNPGEHLEDWMVNNIRDSHNLWMRNYENNQDLLQAH